MSSSISPLFAVHAEQFLTAGMYADALELCLRGIEIYPHYPLAYTLTARAMWALGEEARAQEFIVNAVSIFPTHRALLRLEQEFFGLLPVTHTPLDEKLLPETDVNNDLSLQDENRILENEDIILGNETTTVILENSLLENDDRLPENEDILGETEDILPGNDDILPENDDILPENDDILSEIEDSLPEIENTQPEIENTQPEIVTIQPEQLTSVQDIPLETSDDEEPEEQIEQYAPMRIIESPHALHAYQSSINASNMNLIPGLDFTPLKFQNGRSQPKNGILPAAPPFPRFRERILKTEKIVIAPKVNIPPPPKPVNFQSLPTPSAGEAHKLTPLEELAARLEKVRIPATHEEITRTHTTELVPAMVTETMARIYEKQGAFPEAIKAYQILARRTPEKLEFYEERIREVQGRMMEE